MKQVANRLKKFFEIENKRVPTKPIDFATIIGAILGVFGGYG